MMDLSELEPLISPESYSVVVGSVTNEVHYETKPMQINRPVYQLNQLNSISDYAPTKKITLSKKIENSYNKFNLTNKVLGIIPILSWLPQYKFHENMISDIIAGLTVAVMHIPQGLAYAILGNVPAIVGIYMAFFPIFIYTIFGTSRHISMGTFAVVCLMVGNVIWKNSPQESMIANITSQNITEQEYTVLHNYYAPMDIAIAICMVVGIYQIIMYFLNLGVISTFLSPTLVNGFTTGAAIQVFMTQVVEVVGIKIPRHSRYFGIVYDISSIATKISNINWLAFGTSITCMVLLIINNEILKPKLAKKTKFPIPIELIIIIVGTTFSYYGQLGEKFNLRLVNDIPTGLPIPAVPSWDAMKLVAFDSVSITIVSYVISVSMALIFAAQMNYEIHSNQELLAMGLSNVFGSFFSCMPSCASLSRSMVQFTVGGKTQITSLVSCFALLFVLLWIGPCFEKLPRCVLAAIIIVSLKGLFMQSKLSIKYWKLNKLDFFIWISTFLATVFIDVDIGLLVGLTSSVTTLLIKALVPYSSILGNIPGTDFYFDITRYNKAVEIPGIKIFHYSGSLNFANCASFQTLMYRNINLHPGEVFEARERELKKIYKQGISVPSNDRGFQVYEFKNDSCQVPFKCLIWELSSVGYIDLAGVSQLKWLSQEFERVEVTVLLTGLACVVFDMIAKCEDYEKDKHSFMIFPTVHDAVLFAKDNLLQSYKK